MERWVGRVAVVTGASSGIGAAVSRLLVSRGMKVAGCARRADKLQVLSEELHTSELSGTFLPVKCDVSSEDDVIAMFAKVDAELGGVDVLVNNAGFGRQAPLLSGKTQDWQDMLNTNVLGLTICTREAYKSMEKRNVQDGHIINISSLNGHIVPGAAESHFYSATKFAVTAITEGIRHELREKKSQIRISCISPGVVETRFSYEMRGEERSQKFYSSLKCLQGSDIAECLEYLLAAPPHVQVHDVLMRPTEQVP